MPNVFCFGGPNGAGKTTLALKLLPSLECREFVNADLIAKGLAPFALETAALQAGRLMVSRLDELVRSGASFGFESTLASCSTAAFLGRCRDSGYGVHLIYVWLRDVELHIARVAARVQAGGHDVPEDVIRRRYKTSLKNLNELVLPMCNSWRIYENASGPHLIARGEKDDIEIIDAQLWQRIIHR
jgi:predicted ABC-type ATPase